MRKTDRETDIIQLATYDEVGSAGLVQTIDVSIYHICMTSRIDSCYISFIFFLSFVR